MADGREKRAERGKDQRWRKGEGEKRIEEDRSELFSAKDLPCTRRESRERVL